MKKRVIIGLMVGIAVFVAVFATAASLGGITSDDVGADDQLVASCDSDGVSTSYTTTFAASNQYEVTDVTVDGIGAAGGTGDACDGQTLEVTLVDTLNNVVGSGTLGTPIDADSETVNVTDVSAEGVTEVHVLIAQ